MAPAQRKPPSKAITPLVLRLPGELVALLDRWVDNLNAKAPDGPQWSRTDLVRVVLKQAAEKGAAAGVDPGAQRSASEIKGGALARRVASARPARPARPAKKGETP